MAPRKSWQANWVDAGKTDSWGRSGGQGRLRLVRRHEGRDGTLYVLKELKQPRILERRARMRREVIALETMPHQSTPRVVDHNTDRYKELAVELYAVFDFVVGPTLAEYVAANGPLPVEDAVAVVTGILDVLGYYHRAGVGHRDIKPDNIIIRNADCASPVLIDFGLTFNIHDGNEFVTPDSQQVGNRFLSLPEHSVVSGNKRDLRSDLTFCVGILYFALTRIWPGTLLDEFEQVSAPTRGAA